MQPTDLLRRSTPRPFSADFCVMDCAVRLETNSAEALERTRAAFAGYGKAPSDEPAFFWKLIVEPDTGCETTWPERVSFSDRGLSLVNIGQYSFIAVDLAAREAVIFLEERFTKDESAFERLFLPTLLKLTAPALRPQDHPG